MIEIAEKRNKDVAFYHAGICEWVFPRKYDLISVWDSILHLNVEEQKNTIRKINEGLSSKGVFIFTSGAVNNAREHTDTFLGQDLFYGALEIPALIEFIHDCGLVCKHFECDQLPEKHLYIIAQKT